MLAGLAFCEMLSQYPQSAFQGFSGGHQRRSQAVCGPNPPRPFARYRSNHVYLNSVQQMVSGELAGEGLQTGFSRHGLPPQRAPLDTVYPLREHLNSVQRMVSGGYCEGLFPDTVCWTRLRNTWKIITNTIMFYASWGPIFLETPRNPDN